ncbi:cupredoxin domain-containing protein [Paenibacillus lautus]|uniref:cupredoxin domain-containing protein n=1 Tax=Paenibacillus lautus TaxID=1401 RepID=UPI003D2D57FA
MKKWMLIGLTLLLVVVLSACGGGGSSSDESSSSGGSDGVKEIKVTASNFKFEPTEIKVKKGEKVKITLENQDGNHGLAIPDFNVDLQQPGSTEFTADQVGEHEFHCSVMCGAGHSDMKGTLIVE